MSFQAGPAGAAQTAAVPGWVRQGPRRVTGLLHARGTDRPAARLPVRRNDYGTPTAAQKEKFLETNPASKNLPAVRNHCFLTLAYDEVTPSPRNAQAVVAIARWLHPAAFGLPADGS